MKAKRFLEFGAYRLDPVERRLWRGTEHIPLTPRVFDTLCYMACNAGRLLTKEELRQAIWPDRFVEEANLTQNVSVLRRALGEAASGTKYIATCHGRGYQFLLPVREVGEELPLANPPAPQTPWWRRPWLSAAGIAAASIAMAVLILFHRNGPSRPATVTRTPLTRLPGSEYQPVLSRDGTKLAFVWDVEGRKADAIYVKGPEDDEARAVSVADQMHSSPAWSPDGNFLAYLRQQGDALVLVIRPYRGDGLREVANLFPTRYGLNCRHLDWSPDGKRIVVDDKSSPGEPLGLYLIDLATGRRTPLSGPKEDIIGDVEPRFSPDGRTVSFVRMYTRFAHELFTVPVFGGQPVQRTNDQKVIGGHDWAPNGRSIFFSSNRDGGFRVWRAILDDRKSLAAFTHTEIASANPIQLSVARLGGKVVYSDLLQDLNIWRLQLRREGAGEWTRVIDSTGEDILPHLSPDGSRLCFLSDRSGDGQLWVSNSDGSGPTQLTRGSIRPVAGRWSPDGKTLVFNVVNGQIMYMVDAAGGLSRLFNGSPTTGGHPAFSADGRGVFYGRDSRQIFYAPLAGGAAVPLVSRIAHQKIPSPDGRYLYFTEGRTDSVIWRAGLSSGKLEKIVDDLLPGYWGAWALAANGIYYLTAGEKSRTGAVIRYVDFSGTGRTVCHFPGPLPPIGTSTWAVSPDQRHLYCVRADVSHSDITLVRGL